MVAKDQTEGEVIKESVRVQIKKSRVLGQTDQELHMKELEREKWETERGDPGESCWESYNVKEGIIIPVQ